MYLCIHIIITTDNLYHINHTHITTMKKIILFSLLILSSLIAKAQNADQMASEAISKNDWYTLKDLCSSKQAEMNPALYAFSNAMVLVTFNRNEEAEDAFKVLLGQYANDIGLENVINMAFLACRNYELMQEYAKAADICREMIELVESIDEVPNDLVDGFRTNMQRYLELAKYPAASVAMHSEGWTVPFRINTFETSSKQYVKMTVHTTINGNDADAIFDTGAGVNMITPEYAEKLGLKYINTDMTVNGGGQVTSRMAIAESLTLGDMQMNNVLFTVLEMKSGNEEADKNMNDVNIIIGLPCIRLAREITMDFQKNTITIPATPHEYSDPNITFSPANHLLFARCMHNGEPIDMNLDTGATGEWGHLDSAYYAAHKAEIDAITEFEEDRSAGLGGVTVETKPVLRDFALTVGGKECIFPRILVSKQENPQGAIAISALGMKYFSQQNRVTISIPYSKIIVE